MEFVLVVGGVLLLMALVGSHWMVYRKGYYKGMEEFAVEAYERELQLERECEERMNYNSNFEEVPMFLKKQAE